MYCIQPNYHTVLLNFLKILNKLLVKYPPNKGTLSRKISRGLNDAYEILFSDFLYKSICCGYSFELPRLVKEIKMSSQNICLFFFFFL